MIAHSRPAKGRLTSALTAFPYIAIYKTDTFGFYRARFDVDKKETEKVRYFRDDDDATLRDLVAAEKHGDPRKGNYDLNYADNISRDKRYKGHTTEKDRDEAYDDEYDNDAGLEAYESRDKKQSDAKRQEKARQRQVFECTYRAFPESVNTLFASTAQLY